MYEDNKVPMILTIVTVIAAIVLTFVTVVNSISSSRIDSWLHRAKDAGNPAQVAEFLQNYKTSLDDAGRIGNRYYTLFKYPGTYMPVYIRAVDGLIERAQALSIQSPTDTSYQMGLVNLEKDLGDIEAVAYSVWFANGGFWVVIPMTLCWILCLIFGIAWIGS